MTHTTNRALKFYNILITLIIKLSLNNATSVSFHIVTAILNPTATLFDSMNITNTSSKLNIVPSNTYKNKSYRHQKYKFLSSDDMLLQQYNKIYECYSPEPSTHRSNDIMPTTSVDKTNSVTQRTTYLSSENNNNNNNNNNKIRNSKYSKRKETIDYMKNRNDDGGDDDVNEFNYRSLTSSCFTKKQNKIGKSNHHTYRDYTDTGVANTNPLSSLHAMTMTGGYDRMPSDKKRERGTIDIDTDMGKTGE